MEFIKKVIHYLTYIIYVLIIIYALIWLPVIFGYKPLIVLSGSMEPTYSKGSVIYYKMVSSDKISINDIITFKGKNDELISHRVTNIENGLYSTKGDANRLEDASKIEFNKIVGKNINIKINYIGYYIKYIQEHVYLILLVILILLLDFILSNKVRREENEK